MDFNSQSTDIPHVPKEPQIDVSLSLFLQELDILFKTEKASVFGNRELGNSIEHLLWQTEFNSDYVRAQLAEQIKASCYMNEHFAWEVEVKLFVGSHRDIALIDVAIKDKHDNTLLETTKFQFR